MPADATSLSGLKAPPPQRAGNEGLTPGAISFILKSNLRPDHHERPQVLQFINSYINCRDVRQAAKEANLTSNDGRKLKDMPDVHAAITALTEASLDKYGFNAHDIVEKVKEIANVDLAEFENEDGTYKTSLRDIRPEVRRAIKKFKCKNIYGVDPNGLKVVEGQLIEVELWDKMKSIELLGREKDLFKETNVVQHDVTSKMKDILLASRDRAEMAAIEARKERVVEAIEVKSDSKEA